MTRSGRLGARWGLTADDAAVCLELDPATGSHVAGPRTFIHLAQGNGCPELRTFDVLETYTGGLGTPVGDETYTGPAKGTVSFASVANDEARYRTVIDGVSLHHRRDWFGCAPSSPATQPIAERLGEVLDWFGVGPGACNTTSVPVDVDPGVNPLPARFALIIRSANPVMNSTRARFQVELPASQDLRVQVFDIAGRLVATLAEGEHPAGTHDVQWDLRNNARQPVSGGVYLVRAKGTASITQRLVVLR